MRTLLEIFIENKQGTNLHVMKFYQENSPDIFAGMEKGIEVAARTEDKKSLIIRANAAALVYMDIQAIRDGQIAISKKNHSTTRGRNFKDIPIVPMEQSK